MKIFYSQQCLGYGQPGHPESPQRVEATFGYLSEKGYDFDEPSLCSDDDILRAHTEKLLQSVKSENFFDYDTPAFKGIYDIARLAAGSAIQAAMHCLEKHEPAFSLMRPPGHHATKNNLGGFCYFNNIAIACLKAQEKAGKIAVVDFDCHHGNGTEDIFLNRENLLYLSLHQSPLYPGTGLRSRGNCINYPLQANTTPDQFLAVFEDGLQEVRNFNPDLLGISAGFDSYKLDPITNLTLEKKTYKEIGMQLANLQKPVFAILEGGYSKDLPDCIYQFLLGLET